MSAALVLAVPLAPLAAALVALVAAPRRPAWCGALALTGNAVALAALFAAPDMALRGAWLLTGSNALTVGLLLDPLARYMALLVATAALPINIYSLGYMARDPGRGYFHAAMAFFLGAMLTLVLAGSLPLLFGAWEAVGLASFLLIGYHHREGEARSAALTAFLVTRAADAALLLGWLLAWRLAGTDDIGELAQPLDADPSAAIVALLFLAGALGKSAQLPFSAWLPRAMAGPTPVSALIHSATMVAAGVYLLLRFSPLFASAPGMLTTAAWLGGATALFAALLATAQADLKRVLAWSTSSHLGEMFLAIGLAGPLGAAFMLATHAAFKSALFLAAGMVERATETRALHRLGALARSLPLAGTAFIVAAAALAGIPPLSGFFSDERLLAAALGRTPALGVFVLALIALGGVYIGRAATATFGRWSQADGPLVQRPAASLALGTLLATAAALALGAVLAVSIEHLLAFDPAPAATSAWGAAAALAGAAGLAFGFWRVKAAGPVPAVGSSVLVLERALEWLTRAPARAALAAAALIEWLERRLDALARGVATGALKWASAEEQLETAFDAAAKALARSALGSARLVDALELRAFAHPVDASATLIGEAGGRLRTLESGKLYLYTASVFLWILAVLAGALFLL